jgi:LmbE family N-acetylglucosaminyl deacetylase
MGGESAAAGRTAGLVRPRLLGVFAHPDDETFCAGGTFARYAKGGAEITVVSATRGQAGQIRDSSTGTRRTIAAVREAELRLACQRLGVARVRCWDYLDGALAEADFPGLVGQVVQLIREFQPNVVISFGPDGGYGHPDHITISAATTAACGLAGNPDSYPGQLAGGVTPHQPDRLYHAYFPSHDVPGSLPVPAGSPEPWNSRILCCSWPRKPGPWASSGTTHECSGTHQAVT